jgi:cell division protein FtsB
MSNNRKTKIIFVSFYLILVLAFSFYLLFNESGLLKYFELKDRVDEINIQILKAEQDINKLNAEIDSLKNSQVKIEQVAREKYDMHKPNEIGYKVGEKQ